MQEKKPSVISKLSFIVVHNKHTASKYRLWECCQCGIGMCAEYDMIIRLCWPSDQAHQLQLTPFIAFQTAQC